MNTIKAGGIKVYLELPLKSISLIASGRLFQSRTEKVLPSALLFFFRLVIANMSQWEDPRGVMIL